MELYAPVGMKFKVEIPLILSTNSQSVGIKKEDGIVNLYEPMEDGSSILSLAKKAEEKGNSALSSTQYLELLTKSIEVGTLEWLWHGRVTNIRLKKGPWNNPIIKDSSLLVTLEASRQHVNVRNKVLTGSYPSHFYQTIGHGSYFGLIDVEDESQKGEILSPDLGGITFEEADHRGLLVSCILSSYYLTLCEYQEKREDYSIS